MSSDIPIKATKTTFDIIETLANRDGAGISELANHLNLPKSTIHDHLTTLNELGYISKHDGVYRVGTRILFIGSQIQENMDIYNVAVPELNRLAESTGEHASLMIEENDLGIYLHTAESSNTIKVISTDGMATELHTTAPGKAILAHISEECRNRIIEKRGLMAETENTITDREELDSALQKIRERGYAYDREEAVRGMRGVAAPVIRQQDEQVVGAISIYGPSRRTDIQELESEVVNELLRTVNIIEVNLSY